MRPIFTYFNADKFNPAKGEKDKTKMNEKFYQGELVNLWVEGWKKRGWDTRVLRPGASFRHHLYTGFYTKFLKDWAAVDQDDFLKYLAVSATGGGWLANDYSVINFGLKFVTRDPNQLLTTYQQGNIRLLSGNHDAFEAIVYQMYHQKPTKEKFTDYDVIKKYVEKGKFLTDPKIVDYSPDNEDWKTAELVKFPTDKGAQATIKLIKECGRKI